MYFTKQPHLLIQEMMKHPLEHFRIDPSLHTITIMYEEVECEVYSKSIEPIYLKEYENYQVQAARYQEALGRYEDIEQAYLAQEDVTAEDLAQHQQLVLDATPKEYALWYAEVVNKIIEDDLSTFTDAAKIFLTSDIKP